MEFDGLEEYIDDYMREHLDYVYDELLDDIKYTFENDIDTDDIKTLPRDISEALNSIDLDWVIENHIECNSYDDNVYEAISEWVVHHADSDEIICDYGICNAVREYWESNYDEDDLALRIVEDHFSYSSKDIFYAIYDEAVEYIKDELADWYLDFIITEADDYKSLVRLLDKHDIDYTTESTDNNHIVSVHTYEKGMSRKVEFHFISGYRNTVRANGMWIYFTTVDIDDSWINVWLHEELLGHISVTNEE